MTDPCSLTATEARRLIGAKALSPVELLDSCIRRIEAANPAVNAMVALDLDRARDAAAEAEAAVMAGKPLGPLHGLPVGIKDMTETAGLRTTFGSPLFADHVPARDDRIVADLRAAGAIILGKTNTPEFAAGAVTNNPVYGATGNPFDPALTCGGSSGGSAVALAADMVPLATGSDFGGSLRIPAAWCGVVGFRPSPGLVPNEKSLRGWSPLSVEGPMARTTADLALMLSVMAGDDPRDPLTRPVDSAAFRSLPDIDLSTIRVGFSEDLGFAPVERGIRETFRSRIAALAPLVQSMEPIDLRLEDADETFAVLRGAGFLSAHADRVDRMPDKVGPRVVENVRYAESLTLRQVVAAEAAMTRIARHFQRSFDRFDILICPTNPVTPFPKDQAYCAEIDGQPMSSYFQWLGLTYGLTLTGSPVACLPCGLDPKGIPFGLQLAGPKGGDLRLLAVTHALERALAGQPELARPIPAL